jgi:hypothetical protein
MHRLHTTLTVILALALIVSLVLWRNGQRDLKQQLHTVTDANGVLRQSLGDLTVAITQKEQEIDRLQSSCAAQAKEPDSLRIPLPRKAEPAKPSNHAPIGAN